jgi:molybdate transport system ATP-binding protein
MNSLGLQFDISLERTSGFQLQAQLEVEHTGLMGIFGPSGCGKTTLLRCLAGCEPSVKGKIVVAGRVWLDTQARINVPTHGRELAYVFQDAALFPHLRVKENILYGYRRTDPSQQLLSFDEMVHLTGCENLLSRQVTQLSGGEKQRVAMARALLSSPKLLLFDEPLASLDRDSRRQIVQLIQNIHQRLSGPMLYVTHHVEELAVLSDHVAIVNRGRIVAQGPSFSMLARHETFCNLDNEILTVVEAQVSHYDAVHQLVSLSWAGGQMRLPMPEGPTCDTIRLIIHADDVSFTEAQPVGSSILNSFPVTITGEPQFSGPYALIPFEAGGVPLLGKITRFSALQLQLCKGRSLYAQIKSVTLEGSS